MCVIVFFCFFFQAEDGIRDAQESRGLGDVYKRQKLKLSPLYAWVYETAAKDSFVSIEKAEKVLGFKPKHSNKDALIRNYQWYLNNLASFEHSTGVSHRVPWNQGILKLAKKFF